MFNPSLVQNDFIFLARSGYLDLERARWDVECNASLDCAPAMWALRGRYLHRRPATRQSHVPAAVLAIRSSTTSER